MRTRRRANSSTHLYAKANHDDEMAALGALAASPKYHGDNVIPLHG